MTSSIDTRHSSQKSILYPNAHWYFALAVLVTWIGFFVSYFARLREANLFHHLHGASAGLWMILLIVQPILYQRGQFSLHRRLGRLGSFVLAPLLVLGGLKMLHQGMQPLTGKLPSPAYQQAYQLAWYDVVLLLIFILSLSLSLWHRKQLALHARYIVCTVLAILPPAVARVLLIIPWFRSNFDKSLLGSVIAMELVLLLLLLDDRRYGPIRRPYALALGLFLCLTLTMSFSDNWSWWRAVIHFFVNQKI